jgi:hypothetical protein
MRKVKTLGLALLLSLSILPAALSAKEHRNTYNSARSVDEHEGRNRNRHPNAAYYDQREPYPDNRYYRAGRADEYYYQRNGNRGGCYRGRW